MLADYYHGVGHINSLIIFKEYKMVTGVFINWAKVAVLEHDF